MAHLSSLDSTMSIATPARRPEIGTEIAPPAPRSHRDRTELAPRWHRARTEIGTARAAPRTTGGAGRLLASLRARRARRSGAQAAPRPVAPRCGVEHGAAAASPRGRLEGNGGSARDGWARRTPRRYAHGASARLMRASGVRPPLAQGVRRSPLTDNLAVSTSAHTLYYLLYHLLYYLLLL